MTEADWLTCAHPQAMLDFLRGRGSERKLRLLAVGFALRYFEYSESECDNRFAVTIAEHAADGRVTPEELARFHGSVVGDHSPGYADMSPVANPDVHQALRSTYGSAAYYLSVEPKIPPKVAHWYLHVDPADRANVDAAKQTRVYAELAELVREVIGNPFRPALLDPAWLTWNDGVAVKLALAIYDDHAFDRLPILADALEEAGCGNTDILDHCRQPRVHVRGCWLVDLLLGKE
jgi:hypothetical protein